MTLRSDQLLAAVAGVLISSVACALPPVEAELALRAIPEIRRANEASWVGMSPPGHHAALTADAELRLQSAGVSLVGTLRGSKVEQGPSKASILLNELFYETGWGATRLSLGKRILSWDVGVGYRPLDVLQRDDQRQLVETTYEGVPAIVLDRYTERNAVTLVLANPGSGMEPSARRDASVALRLYHRGNGWDGYLIARRSRRSGIEIGPAVSASIGEGLEVHGSVAVQQRGGYATIGAPAPRDASVKALGGFTLTLRSGVAVAAEYWHDGTAPAGAAWDCLDDALLCGADPHVPLEAQRAALYGGENLRRDNLFTRISLTRGRWVTAVDAVLTPQDNGRIVTASTRVQGSRHSLQIGMRAFGGSEEAAVNHVQTRHTAFLAWQLRL